MHQKIAANGMWLIVTFGMALRLIWVLLVPVEPVSDSGAYAAFARNIFNHGVYGWRPDEPGAYWAVGTAAITAATYFVFPVDDYSGVVVLNLLAGLLTMILTYRLAEIWFDRSVAFLAVLTIAIWPNLIFFTSILSSELWFIALTLGGMWFWARLSVGQGRGWINLVLCGVIWGLACYVRPTILLLPLALALVALPGGPLALVRAGLRAAVVIALILAAVSPWTYRNTQLFGERVLVSTNFGPNLWMGNNPETNGGYMPLPDWVAGMSETERAHLLGNIAKDYILSDIPGFALRTLYKVVKLHERETIGVVWNEAALVRGVGETGLMALKLLATGYWHLLLGLAFVAIGLRLRDCPRTAVFHPAIVTWGYFAALHAVIVVEDRYHIPSSPFIGLLAAFALAYLFRRAGLFQGFDKSLTESPKK